MKGNRPHAIPLGDMASAILGERPKPLLFAGDRGKRFTNFSNMEKEFDRLNIPGWTLHDLRRTFATEWAKLGIPPHVPERMLAHSTSTISGVAAIYNRHSYLPEMREAVSIFEPSAGHQLMVSPKSAEGRAPTFLSSSGSTMRATIGWMNTFRSPATCRKLASTAVESFCVGAITSRSHTVSPLVHSSAR